MNIINYDYTTSTYDLLSLFENHEIKPSTLVLVSGSQPTMCFDNHNYLKQLAATDYNYAVMSDPQTGVDWQLTPNSTIPMLDTKVFLINNVASAQHVFQLAKLCRNNIDFYRKLYHYNFSNCDNITLSIANHIYNGTTGFFNYPCKLIKRFKCPHESLLNYGYDPTTKALVNYSKVTSIV